MTRVAFLFPGQGSQSAGMGRDLAAEFPEARETFAEADEALGVPLSRLCFDGPDEELTLTANAQPAILCLSVAVARILERRLGVSPVVGAGHSLGEWSALVVAGALSLPDALRAVRERGRRMQDAVASGLGAMSALLGAEVEEVEALCRAASTEAAPDGPAGVVVPANLNGAGQIVVAGDLAAVERLEKLAGERRMRCTRLSVSAPFHSPLMAPARAAMEPVVAALALAPPRFPVVSNVDAVAHSDVAGTRRRLLAQITAPVRWEECARAVIAASDRAIEVGPGRVLTGLLRRIDRGYPCQPTADPAGVRAVLEGATAWPA